MYKGYLIDLDGTLYRGTTRIPEAEAFVRKLLQRNIPFKFVTNNATQSIEELKETLNTHYELDIGKEHIYTSTLALIDYLNNNHANQRIYAIGEKGFIAELTRAGYMLVNSEEADVVVQALDRKSVYNDIKIAVQAILNGATFLVTNTDRVLPSENGMIPSSGAITAAIEYATKTVPTVVGKPNIYIMEGALQRLGLDKSDVLMIGDNYETDISAGINAKLDTLLVLTGVTKDEDVAKLPIPPTYVRNTLAEWEI